MKRALIFVSIIFVSGAALAYDDPYRIEVDPYGIGRFGGTTEIEMKQEYNYDPAAKFRGTIDDDGTVRMHNWNGERLRGTIDEDGYGKLLDENGTVYRIKPR